MKKGLILNSKKSDYKKTLKLSFFCIREKCDQSCHFSQNKHNYIQSTSISSDNTNYKYNRKFFFVLCKRWKILRGKWIFPFFLQLAQGGKQTSNKKKEKFRVKNGCRENDLRKLELNFMFFFFSTYFFFGKPTPIFYLL